MEKEFQTTVVAIHPIGKLRGGKDVGWRLAVTNTLSPGSNRAAVARWYGSQSRRARYYHHHRPEQTFLYPLVEEYYPAVVAQLANLGT